MLFSLLLLIQVFLRTLYCRSSDSINLEVVARIFISLSGSEGEKLWVDVNFSKFLVKLVGFNGVCNRHAALEVRVGNLKYYVERSFIVAGK